MKHPFGGVWTQEKLNVLEQYLAFYTQALKNTGFTLHYADAFAGTGSHTPKSYDAQEGLIPLFPVEELKGSVSRALEVDPGFHRYHFNDLNPDHIRALREVKERHPQKDIRIHESNANDFVPQFCNSLGRGDRAVLLLDPYSTQLNWGTLTYIAECEKVDLWLLFPISALLRMTPRDGERVQEAWRETLNRLLGTTEWEQALYKPKERPPMDDLFGEANSHEDTERLNTEELQNWVTGRLKELFPYVGKPFPLKSQGSLLFLFYFAVSNPRKAAWSLADKAASHILTKNIGKG